MSTRAVSWKEAEDKNLRVESDTLVTPKSRASPCAGLPFLPTFSFSSSNSARSTTSPGRINALDFVQEIGFHCFFAAQGIKLMRIKRAFGKLGSHCHLVAIFYPKHIAGRYNVFFYTAVIRGNFDDFLSGLSDNFAPSRGFNN